MKKFFRGYYRLENSEFDALWKNAVVIFDTNVLLNLYRYQSTTRTTLINVIKKLSQRVWIPYHVGLEFQRNRLTVIAEQHNRFLEVKSIVDKALDQMQNQLDDLQLKTRHSHINPDHLLDEIKKAKNSYYKNLDELKKGSISTSTVDTIREEIDSLFEGKIGEAMSQKELDTLYNDGEERYKNNIPPGFKDSSKETECFTYSGIFYQRKFGDLIIWKQIIKHAKSHQIKDLIFITDDNKSDWWLNVKGNTVGARPELIDEICSHSGVERFHMYNTEAFLEYANKKLDAKVGKAALDEVREVVAARNSAVHGASTRYVTEAAERSVYDWLRRRYEHIEPNRGFPDFIVYENGIKIGFEVKLARDPIFLAHRIEELVLRSYVETQKGDFNEINLVLVTPQVETLDAFRRHLIKRIEPLEKKLEGDTRGKLTIVVGSGELIEPNGVMHGFRPYYEISVF